MPVLPKEINSFDLQEPAKISSMGTRQQIHIKRTVLILHETQLRDLLPVLQTRTKANDNSFKSINTRKKEMCAVVDMKVYQLHVYVNSCY